MWMQPKMVGTESLKTDVSMRWLRRLGAGLVALLLLESCAGQPYVDARREAGKRITVGTSNDDMVAICHAGRKPPADAVKLAESECAKTQRVPRFEQSIHFTCTLKTPTRSYFRCVAPPA